MLNKFFPIKFEGDRSLWLVIIFMMILSAFPIYSSSTSLVYAPKSTYTPTSFLLMNLFKTFLGFAIMYLIHKIKVNKIRGASVSAYAISVVLLLFLIIESRGASGVNDSRWVKIPIIGLNFQPSALAMISLVIILSAILVRGIENKNTRIYKIGIWVLILFTPALIVLANLSTAVLVYATCMMLMYIGKYPMKKIFKINGILMLIGVVFFLGVKMFPEIAPSRMKTWVSRIDRWGTEVDEQQGGVDRYQIDNAKIAIAKGEITGVGPGKSVQKVILPQSTSDFVFAIITEEFGLVGALTIIMLFIFLLYRIVLLAIRSHSLINKLIVCGLGFSIIFQTLINLCVAVEIIPVTGQPLPFFSTGGTSIIITSIALGIILSISREEINNNRKMKGKEQKVDELNPLEPIIES